MDFNKLKFKEIINETTNEVQYLINDKFVDKDTYNSLANDDSLYSHVLPPLPKMNCSTENSNNHKTDAPICQCDDCQELLELIYEFRESDDAEALEILRSYLEAVRIEEHLQSLAEAYNELGNSMIKVSGKFELQLEDFISQFAGEYEE